LISNGLGAGRGLVPSRTRVHLRGLPSWLGTGLVSALALGVPFSALVGIVAAIKYGAVNGVSTGASMLAVICVAVGVPVGVVDGLGVQHRTRIRPTRWPCSAPIGPDSWSPR
jgi:hypothetical protein